MKPVRRIFLILGAMSMFSLFQFDAMADQDCKTGPSEGYYCFHKDAKTKCPEGCWCEGTSTHHVSDSVGDKEYIRKLCKNKNATLYELRELADAKVFVCGIDYSGIQSSNNVSFDDVGYNTSNTGGVNMKPESDERGKTIDACKVRWCSSNPGAGKYCSNRNAVGCPAGCYCPGDTRRSIGLDYNLVVAACSERRSGISNIGFDIKKYLESRGVYYCPSAYTSVPGVSSIVAGAVSKTDCVLKENTSEHYLETCPRNTVRQTDGTCKARTFDEAFSDIATQNNSNITLDRDIIYTVTYSCGDGATGTARANGTATYNRLFTPASGGICIKSGFVFDGWLVSGTNDVKQAGVAFVWQYRQNKTFTAQWRDSSVRVYTLSFNAGTPGGDDARGVNVTGSMNSVEYQERASVILPASGFSASGYLFEYWDCGNIGQYRVGGSFLMPGHNVTCTAQWSSTSINNGSTGNNGGSTGGNNGGGTYTGGTTTGGGDNDGTGNGGITTGGDNNGGTGNAGITTGGGSDNNTNVNTCDAGEYLNNDGDCVSCVSGYFCPGNNNRYRCPFNGTSINNGTSCKFNVSKASLYECWDEATSPSNYRGCMYDSLPPLETLR